MEAAEEVAEAWEVAGSGGEGAVAVRLAAHAAAGRANHVGASPGQRRKRTERA